MSPFIHILSVKGALAKYFGAELLDDFNLRRKITKLPPVLCLCLKRFKSKKGRIYRVHDEFAFDRNIDMEQYVNDPTDSNPAEYTLHAVYVHAGATSHSGHYYVYVYININNEWYCFDDARVRVCPESEAIQDNFGNEDSGRRSAYMLMYVRQSDRPWILGPAERPSSIKPIDEANSSSSSGDDDQYRSSQGELKKPLKRLNRAGLGLGVVRGKSSLKHIKHNSHLIDAVKDVAVSISSKPVSPKSVGEHRSTMSKQRKIKQKKIQPFVNLVLALM